MARCGCVSECNCVLTDGDCTNVSGTGNPGSPFRVDVEVNPDETNQLACGDNGLFVPPPTVAVEDTDCVDMGGTGDPDDPITATPIVDPDPCNLLACGADGLGVQLNTEDGECLRFLGCGTVDDPLTGEPIISIAEGNVLECNNGLFVPAVASGAIQVYGRMYYGDDHTIASSITGAHGIIEYDTVVDDIGGICDAANNRFVVPVGGYYYITALAAGSTNNPAGLDDGGWSIGIEIVVNGSLVRQTNQPRFSDQQNDRVEVNILVPLNNTDVIEGWFFAHSNSGTGAAHDLVEFGGECAFIACLVGV